MDIPLIRTFLELHRTGHFAQAADALFLSQAAVSSRIAQLEDQLGAPLFTRTRNNIALTPAGERLLPHAELVMHAWNRLTLQSSAVAAGQAVLVLGALPSIIEVYAEHWLPRLHAKLPETFLQLQTLDSEALMSRVRGGSLDIGVLYEPMLAPHISATRLLQMPLIAVTSNADQPTDAQRYIKVDWGAAHLTEPEMEWEARTTGVLRVDSPRLARRLLLSEGGVAMLPEPLVAADIVAGLLRPLEDVPTILRDVFVVHDDETPSSETLAAVAALIDGFSDSCR